MKGIHKELKYHPDYCSIELQEKLHVEIKKEAREPNLEKAFNDSHRLIKLNGISNTSRYLEDITS